MPKMRKGQGIIAFGYISRLSARGVRNAFVQTKWPKPTLFSDTHERMGVNLKRKNLAILGLVVIIALSLVIPFAPIVPVSSSSFTGFELNSSQSTYASVSYVIFKCGEVHATFNIANQNGYSYSSSDQYRWVCGQG